MAHVLPFIQNETMSPMSVLQSTHNDFPGTPMKSIYSIMVAATIAFTMPHMLARVVGDIENEPSHIIGKRSSLARTPLQQFGYQQPIAVQIKSPKWNKFPSREWIKRGKQYGVEFGYSDVPGDGNCLFHAISNAFKEIGVNCDHKQLRRQTASAFVGFDGSNKEDPILWDEKSFESQLGCLVGMEIGGEWHEAWKPTVVSNTKYIQPDGKVRDATMLEKARLVWEHMSKPGLHHYGGAADLSYLGNLYGVGFIIMDANGYFRSDAMVGITHEIKYYCFIGYSNAHFMLGRILDPNLPERTFSIISKSQLPQYIRELYKVDTNKELP